MKTKEEKIKEQEAEIRRRKLKEKLRQIEKLQKDYVSLYKQEANWSSKWGDRIRTYAKLPVTPEVLREFPQIADIEHWKLSVENQGRKLIFESGALPVFNDKVL